MFKIYSIVVAQSVYLRQFIYTGEHGDKRKYKNGHSKGLAMMTAEGKFTV